MNNSSMNHNDTRDSKTLEFNYVGYEYDMVKDFSFSWKDSKGKSKELEDLSNILTGTTRSEDKDQIAIGFKNHVLLNCLIKSEKISASKDNSHFSIECGNYRKKHKEAISIFLDREEQNPENHTEYSKINGLLGAITIEYDSSSFPELQYNTCIISRNKYDKLRVNIHFFSRLDKTKESEQPKPFFTAALLTGGSVERFNDSVHFNSDNLFDFLLIDKLGKELKKAYKKGLFRSYRQFYGNNERPRGSIDVARHIKLNAGLQNGRIAFTYKENTVNNYLNILILKTYEYIKKKYPEVVRVKIDNDKVLKDFIRELSVEANASEVSVHWAATKNIRPISHPYYNEYEEVRKTCLRIFRNEGVSIFNADAGEISGYVYYSPDLWEDCLNKLFRKIITRYFEKINVEDQASRGFLSNDEQENYFCKSRPDFVFKNSVSDRYDLVLDAKLIPNMEYFFESENSKYIQADFGKSIDKAIRDMEVWGTKGTGLVFPVGIEDQFENNTDEESLQKNRIIQDRIIERYYGERFHKGMRNMGGISERTFGILPFPIPYSRNYNKYSVWKCQYNQFEKIFSDNLKEVFKSVFCEN